MTSMVERVAKALAARDGHDWADMPPYREGYMENARLAISKMRTLTPAMKRAARDAWPAPGCLTVLSLLWPAVIDAALADAPGAALCKEATMPSELLPCPFCGGAAEKVDNGPTKEQVQNALSWGQDFDDGGSFIHCTACDASSALHFDRRENLVDSWNRRVNSIDREREAIADRAREIAGHYHQGSDGRNTFILLAEWIENRMEPSNAE